MGADRPIADPETLRLRMLTGSLNLRGAAGMLEKLATLAEDEMEPILRLIARDVDLEADTMGEAEVFLLGQAKVGA